MKTKTTCLLCSKDMKMITSTHLKSHNIDIGEYKIQFPKAAIVSEFLQHQRSELAKIANAPRKGVPRSKEVRKKISQNNKGKKAWNKGIPQPNEQKINQSETMKAKYASGELVHWNEGNNWDQETKDKISETLLSKNLHMSKESIEKRNITMEGKKIDGWIPPSCREEVKEKRKKKMMAKFGVENGFQLIEKIKQTNLERYGVENPLQSKYIKDNIKKTNLERYGVENPTQNREISDSAWLSIMRHHGYTQSDKVLLVLREKLMDKFFLENEHKDNKRTITDIACEIGVTPVVLGRYMRDVHGIETQYYQYSLAEKQIVEFLRSIYPGEIIENDRTIISPKEIDIYLPEKQLAIEYNGLYWHSETNGKKDRRYHYNKMKGCNDKDTRLITIWEPEWILKQDIVKSRLKNIIGVNERIFARKCKIGIISSKTKTRFIENTHIQGDCVSKANVGLSYNDELVAVMTFGASRFDKKVQYELLRYTCKQGTNIVGGASRLFKWFIENYNPNSIKTYADLRWNTGELYTKLGFTFDSISNSNYYYFDTEKNDLMLFPRVKFQKHKLEKNLKIFEDSKTERENMIANNYDRIWDCGNSVWIWKSL